MKSILIIALLSLAVFANETPELTKVMNEIEIKTKATMYDTTAEAVFTKGFRYLNGIETEQNTSKGLLLITRSSQIGYRKAQEKLATMYCTGDKVEKDLKKMCLLG